MSEADRSISPDATFFVDRLHQAVETIRPWVARSLRTRVDFDSRFAKSLQEWAVKQGIANYGDEPFYALIGSQVTYRFIGKVIFYETLRKWRTNLPEPDLRVSSQFFGAQEVTSERGFSYKARTPPEAKFVVYAQASGTSEARIPQEPLEQFKAVSAYEVYLRKLRVELLEALRSRTMNQKIAVRLLDDIWQEYRLPSISEST